MLQFVFKTAAVISPVGLGELLLRLPCRCLQVHIPRLDPQPGSRDPQRRGRLQLPLEGGDRGGIEPAVERLHLRLQRAPTISRRTVSTSRSRLASCIWRARVR